MEKPGRPKLIRGVLPPEAIDAVEAATARAMHRGGQPLPVGAASA